MSEADFQFIAEYEADNLDRLLLNASKYKGVDVSWAVGQIAARRQLQRKLPLWCSHRRVIFPVRVSQEQCSSEATARYKALLCEGRTMVDLTGGFGVDAYFIGQRFDRVNYVERNGDLCAIARHNFRCLGFEQVSVHEDDAVSYLQACDGFDLIYIDPARRNADGNRVYALEDCTPDVLQLKEELRAKSQCLLLKLSPMLDIAAVLRSFPETTEVHVVSVDGECKELLFKVQWGAVREPRIVAVNLCKGVEQLFEFTLGEEAAAQAPMATSVERYLYEPNVSLLKAGAFKSVAKRYGLKKLHPNTHLYTSEVYVAQFAGRVFEVQRVCGFAKRELAEVRRTMSVANVAVRNFPDSVELVRKRLKLGDGGDAYLFACTGFGDEKLLIVCKKC